ncbi:MAG: DNA polymerase III subunit alpha [Candidatus Muirbacterium halophilum]|nr:DNA polymerase III subunit alpha [Candidatus Muirbacterium halophilum]MCK9474959.1 DNA polymerase III subunit alpha [Candidatus Muirbacterium halophilum]
MKRSEFAHLNIYSTYSIGTSVLKIDDIVEYAKKNKFFSIALTDKDNLSGCIDFYYKALEKGLKPIIGCDLTFQEGSLILLCKNNAGFKNLISLVSKKNSPEGLKLADLFENHEGIIVLSGGNNSVFYNVVYQDRLDILENELIKFRREFGEDFYIQLSFEKQKNIEGILHLLKGIGETLGIASVLTFPVKYATPSHVKILDAFNCILNAKTYYSETNRETAGQEYFKDIDEIKKTGFEKAIAQTLELARKCNVLLDKKIFLPKYKLPEEFSTSSEYLLYLCSKNLEKFYKEEQIIKARERLNKELSIINSMGFEDYFLIVWDIVNYAKNHDITIGPGRGSAVSSIAAYLLEITEIDPVKHELIFERFLNLERKDLPDIDIDVCSEKREKLITYVRNRFGKKKVASIISFGKFKTALSIRELGKVLEVSDEKISKAMNSVNRRMSIEDNIQKNLNFSKLVKTDNEIYKLAVGAQNFEGLIRNVSQHAAGIVIFPENLDKNIPVNIDADKTITQWDKDSLEKFGALKIDLLSLKTLSTIDHIMKKIRVKKLVVDYEDSEVYKMISEGKTAGIFQLETANMTRFVMLLKPQNFEELCLLSAVVRPGARDNFDLILENREKGENNIKNRVLADILKTTYGVIIYQEQIMTIAQRIASFNLQKADDFRKAISKKDYHLMKQINEDFVSGALKNKYDKEFAQDIFDDIVKFAGYGFNKAHAVAYTAITYKCAWLKQKHPIVFFTKLLNSEIDNQEKIYNVVRELRETEVKILSPDVFKSKARFTGSTKGIRYAFSAIKGIGYTNGRLVEDFLKKTSKNFKDYNEFILKSRNHAINSNIIKALIYSGACDKFKKTRKFMIENIEQEFNYNSLFEEEKTDENKEYSEILLREKEKEFLGFTFTWSNIDDFEITIRLFSEISLTKLKETQIDKIRVSGVISKKTQEKENYTIEIEDGKTDLFIKCQKDDFENIRENDVVVCDIKKVDNEYFCQKINHVKELFANENLKLVLKLEESDNIDSMKDVFDMYNGNHEIIIVMATEQGKVMLETLHRVRINESLLEELEEIVGVENMALRLE